MADNTGTLYATSSTALLPPGSATLPSGTSGQTLRHNGTVWTAASNLFNNGTNVGIGTTAPDQKLKVQGTFGVSKTISTNENLMSLSGTVNTITSGDAWGVSLYQIYTPPSNSTARIRGLGGYVTVNPSASAAYNASAYGNLYGAFNGGVGSASTLYGGAFYSRNNSSGSVESAIGVRGFVDTINTTASTPGTITYAQGGSFGVTSAANGSVITNAYGVYITSGATLNGGTINNNYGLYIANQNVGVTRNYAIYSSGGSVYFGGNVGLGTTNPNYKLDVNGDFRASGNNFSWNAQYTKQVAYRVGTNSISRSEVRIPWPNTSSGPIILDVEVMVDTNSVGSRHYIKKRFYLTAYTGSAAGTLYSQDSYVTDSLGGNSSAYINIGNFENDTANSQIILPIYAGPNSPYEKSIVIRAWGTRGIAALIEGATFHNNVQTGITPPGRAVVEAPPGDDFVFYKNVGIGTTTPIEQLHVAPSKVDGGIFIDAGRFSPGNRIVDLYTSNDSVLRINAGNGMYDTQFLVVGNNFVNNPGRITFRYGNRTTFEYTDGSSFFERMRITSAGNLGIGITNPNARLTVNGNTVLGGATQITPLGGAGNVLIMADNTGTLYATTSSAVLPTQLWSGNLNGNIWNGDAGAGNVGIGITNPTEKLHVDGNVKISGTLQTQTGSDFAEEFSVTKNLSVGTVVVMDSNGYKSVKSSTRAYDKTVVGIVSDNPSIIAGRVDSEKKVVVAMMGVVSVNVCNESGTISRGDLLTTANTDGYAMKASEFRPGTVIGKALENFSGSKGKIKVLVNLQ
jgi:hypothetical protein